MKIGWFAWQPELVDPATASSAGGASWTRFILDEYLAEGHEVVWLTSPKAPEHTRWGRPEDCDIVIINWRWQMPAYPERSVLYNRQWAIIKRATSKGIPVVAHDQDHKMTMSDFKLLKSLGVTLCSPELQPRQGFESLFYPAPEFERPRYGLEAGQTYDIVYVGNVYERYAQAVHFLSTPDLQVSLYGNWLEDGPDRPGAAKAKHDLPNAFFGGRVVQQQVVQTLTTGKATIHLFKPSYEASGFMTLRWAEAAAAEVPALVPSTFFLPPEWRSKFVNLGLLVSNALEVAEWCWTLTPQKRRKAVELQKKFVQSYMTTKGWFDLLKKG